MQSMELYDQIRKISFAFFAAIGTVHFLSGLFFVNQYMSQTSMLINRISFIPFVIVSLTYALSNFKYQLSTLGKDSKSWTWAFLGLTAAVFLILISLEFFVADLAVPLTPTN